MIVRVLSASVRDVAFIVRNQWRLDLFGGHLFAFWPGGARRCHRLDPWSARRRDATAGRELAGHSLVEFASGPVPKQTFAQNVECGC